MEATTSQKWSTADITTLDFKTWYSISEAMGTFPNVSVTKWVQTVKPELLKSLTLEEWEDIANTVGFSDAWAYRKFKELR